MNVCMYNNVQCTFYSTVECPKLHQKLSFQGTLHKNIISLSYFFINETHYFSKILKLKWFIASKYFSLNVGNFGHSTVQCTQFK